MGCPKRFPHVSLLQIHERVHTGEKPFQCNDCGQCFGSQSSLIKHNRNIHTPEDQMPYKCSECGKTFSKARRKVYFGHLKQHSGIKDHICPLCNAAFSSRGYLGNHFKKVHKRKLYEVEKELQSKIEAGNKDVPQQRYVQEYQMKVEAVQAQGNPVVTILRCKNNQDIRGGLLKMILARECLFLFPSTETLSLFPTYSHCDIPDMLVTFIYYLFVIVMIVPTSKIYNSVLDQK